MLITTCGYVDIWNPTRMPGVVFRFSKFRFKNTNDRPKKWQCRISFSRPTSQTCLELVTSGFWLELTLTSGGQSQIPRCDAPKRRWRKLLRTLSYLTIAFSWVRTRKERKTEPFRDWWASGYLFIFKYLLRMWELPYFVSLCRQPGSFTNNTKQLYRGGTYHPRPTSRRTLMMLCGQQLPPSTGPFLSWKLWGLNCKTSIRIKQRWQGYSYRQFKIFISLGLR